MFIDLWWFIVYQLKKGFFHMKKEFIIRLAKIEEIPLLEDIIIDSLSMWSYSSEELSGLKNRLKISFELFKKSIAYVVELNKEIVGFWLQEIRSDLSETRFYIKKNFVKRGIGSSLWSYVSKKLVIEYSLDYITFISDANAQEFYKKLGAVKIDETPSYILPGVNLPIMRYNLK